MCVKERERERERERAREMDFPPKLCCLLLVFSQQIVRQVRTMAQLFLNLEEDSFPFERQNRGEEFLLCSGVLDSGNISRKWS